MKAVDTDILARFLLRDDPDQYQVARQILQRDVLLPVNMLHLVTAQDAAAFLTFDRGIAQDAGSDSPLPVELLTTS